MMLRVQIERGQEREQPPILWKPAGLRTEIPFRCRISRQPAWRTSPSWQGAVPVVQGGHSALAPRRFREDRSSWVRCTGAVLRRPSVPSVIRHDEGYFRPADRSGITMQNGGPGPTPPLGVPPFCMVIPERLARELSTT